jgi:hypothetical protein
MGTRDTVLRTMHDAGAAAWFGGSLMGAVGLNGAAADAKDPRERTRLSADGWMRWAPVNAAAIGAHLLGGAGILWANKGRQVTQQGVGSNTALKTAITATALGLSAYGAFLGAKVAKAADQAPAKGATEPSEETPEDIAAAQRQLKVIQWATPVLTGAIVALGAQQGEMQRPRAQVSQLIDKIAA